MRIPTNPIVIKIYIIVGVIILVVSMCLGIWLYMDYQETADSFQELAMEDENKRNSSKSNFYTEWQNNVEYKSSKTGIDSNPTSSVNVKGDGQLITDVDKNPWKIPLYDGLTMDTAKLGITSYEVDFDSNQYLQKVKAKDLNMTNDARVIVGGSYGKVNYGSHAKMGEILPYTEVDGRMSVAIPWRYTYQGADSLSISQPDRSKWTMSKIAGLYFDVVFTDGTVLACILGDAKGVESNVYNGFAHHDGSLIEVLGYSDLPLKGNNEDAVKAYAYEAQMGKQLGFTTFVWNGIEMCQWIKVFPEKKQPQKIVVYGCTYLDGGKETPWFTGNVSQ